MFLEQFDRISEREGEQEWFAVVGGCGGAL